jgi:hypothetical protein
MQKKLFLCAIPLYTMPMTATQEALAAMAKAEEAWDNMVTETVEASGQFQQECQELSAEIKDLKSAK